MRLRRIIPLNSNRFVEFYNDNKNTKMSMVFCRGCGKEIHESAKACPQCGATQVTAGSKNRISAALLAFFLGGIGVHKFYLGKVGQGFLYLIFFLDLYSGNYLVCRIHYLSVRYRRKLRAQIWLILADRRAIPCVGPRRNGAGAPHRYSLARRF